MAKKKTKKNAAKKSAPKKISGSAKPRTKSQIFNAISESTGIARRDVVAVLGGLEELAIADLKKGTPVKVIGMKLTVRKKPATKARKGINPFTGEEMMFKAKPASKAVKVRALKTLNDQI